MQAISVFVQLQQQVRDRGLASFFLDHKSSKISQAEGHWSNFGAIPSVTRITFEIHETPFIFQQRNVSKVKWQETHGNHLSWSCAFAFPAL